MSIEFRCVTCGKLLRTANDTAGKRAKCPDCGTVVTIPAPGEPAAAPAPPLGPAAAAGGGTPPMPPLREPSANPFQSPEAPLDSPPGATTSLAPGRLDFSDLLGTAWAVFKANLGIAVVLTLLYAIIVATVGAVLVILGAAVSSQSPALGNILAIVIYGVIALVQAGLAVGMLKAMFKLARGRPASLGDLFDFGSEVGPFLLTYLLFVSIVSVGLVLCVVPGIILSMMFFPCLALVVDRHVGVLDSFNEARRLTNGNKMTIFVTFLVAGLLGDLAIAITCGVGALFVAPYMAFLYVVAYLRMTGQPIVVPGR